LSAVKEYAQTDVLVETAGDQLPAVTMEVTDKEQGRTQPSYECSNDEKAGWGGQEAGWDWQEAGWDWQEAGWDWQEAGWDWQEAGWDWQEAGWENWEAKDENWDQTETPEDDAWNIWLAQAKRRTLDEPNSWPPLLVPQTRAELLCILRV
jgi:hypothetical protein